ncbi:MAG: hypothetical protein A2X33_00195 [Elusimicrobia bacterium GWA2_51_34]|nr:MAG: hypothetical protein A2X33_00195 [Elusimicrobia bacterium GWA2_51_34]
MFRLNKLVNQIQDKPGDPCQIDNPFLDMVSDGLMYVVDRFKGQKLRVSGLHQDRAQRTGRPGGCADVERFKTASQSFALGPQSEPHG